jgi:hypothetical protein
MKHIKLFESFINEELSPELKKRTYDEMMKIAKDPNAIDNLKRRNQAKNIQSSVTPAVEKLRSELQDHARRTIAEIENPMALRYNYNYEEFSESIGVELEDWGLDNGFGGVNIYVTYRKDSRVSSLIIVNVSKDKYQQLKFESDDKIKCAIQELLIDRAFVNTLKKLIVQIQKDEIPGDEQVPEQPEAITPEGGIN